MSGNVQGLIGSYPGVPSITVNANWGVTSGTTNPILGNSRTLTVPAGNPGTIKLNVSLSGSPPTTKYSKAGGAFTTYTDGTTVSVADGNTFQFEITGSISGDTAITTVKDNTTGATIGTNEQDNTS